MGIINRIAARTASKKAKRIAHEKRRSEIISKRKSGRRTIKESIKETARPFLSKHGRRKLKVDATPQKFKYVKKGKKTVKVKIKTKKKTSPRRTFQERTGFTLNQGRLK